ncbi:MAG TPA: YdcF family protein [Pseudonocardiaceae bacterium]|jgi:uncharacterized SAM-binding protein YcdF (DUF218 family)|nr:YdcF family protein [Pseudonocardiaceae bacterium]
MLFELLTAVSLAVFTIGVAREPRRVSNAVWLGVTALFLLLAFVNSDGAAGAVGRLVVFVVALAVLVLPVALIANGVVMWRREAHRLANLLSLLAGVGIVGVATVTLVAVFSRSRLAATGVASVLLVCAYVTFLFVCLLAYSVFYAMLGHRRGVSAILVLGSGLRGAQVTPLLASRLDRGAATYRREVRTGGRPAVVVSGGQGPGEAVTEASAMRDYLIDHGLPAADILVEDQATTTEQNLLWGRRIAEEHGHSGRMVAVTNNYHVFRTAVFARRLRLPVHVLGARTALYFLPSAVLREFTALVVQYRIVNLTACVLLAAAPWLLFLTGN